MYIVLKKRSSTTEIRNSAWCWEHKLALIFIGTMPSYTNKQSKLPAEWQIAEKKGESARERMATTLPCLFYFFSRNPVPAIVWTLFPLLWDRKQGLPSLWSLRSSGHLLVLWITSEARVSLTYWKILLLIRGKGDEEGNKIWMGKTHPSVRKNRGRGRVKHWWCRAGVKGVWQVLHSVILTWSPYLQKAESGVVENLGMVRGPGLQGHAYREVR